MANRVLLYTNGLKISRPGVNVLTAGNADLLFNSDLSSMVVGQRGSFYVPNIEYSATINLARPVSESVLIFMHAQNYMASGAGVAAHVHPAVGWDALWTLERINATQLRFYQGITQIDGPVGPQPPYAGPLGFPYVANYAIVDSG